LRGISFDYTEGPIHGGIEILAEPTVEEKKPGWKLIVVVHEKAK